MNAERNGLSVDGISLVVSVGVECFILDAEFI
jgi:hypothetical protein